MTEPERDWDDAGQGGKRQMAEEGVGQSAKGLLTCGQEGET